MSAQVELPKDHPMRDAWETYSATDEYKNTRRWALTQAHVDGSLWAAFIAGYGAALPAVPEGFATHGDSALAHLSNALDDLDSSPDQRPVPLIKEAMCHVRAMLAATPAHDQPEGSDND